MTATRYYLSGGPYDGEYRDHDSASLEVVAPRWPPPGTFGAATSRIDVARGRYRHNGYDRCLPAGGNAWVPVMQWMGCDR